MSLNCDHQRAYCPSPTWCMSMESHGGKILTGDNCRTRGKTCCSFTLSTKNPTRSDQGANSGLRGERPATNRLSHVYTLNFRSFWGTHPFLWSSFLLTHTAVNASSRRHSSFFLQFRGWHKSPATQEHTILRDAATNPKLRVLSSVIRMLRRRKRRKCSKVEHKLCCR
jgi:hypothetical protein